MEKQRDNFFLKRKESEKFKAKEERQKEFDSNRKTGNDKDVSEKAPFDKKVYRLKKYSKKYKLEQWEDQRKRKLLNEYKKSIKDEPTAGKYVPRAFDDEPDCSVEVGKFVRHPDFLLKDNNENQNKKRDMFLKAKEHLNKVKQEKLEKKEEKERAREERNQKLQEYKRKKHERFKKLSKKNKKGQPIMTGRLELLLEKIKKN